MPGRQGLLCNSSRPSVQLLSAWPELSMLTFSRTSCCQYLKSVVELFYLVKLEFRNSIVLVAIYRHNTSQACGYCQLLASRLHLFDIARDLPPCWVPQPTSEHRSRSRT